MADKPQNVIVINNFTGVSYSVEQPVENEVPVGTAREQINLTSVNPSMLRVRGGLKVVTFENS